MTLIHILNLGGMLYQASGWRPAAVLPQIAGTVWLAFYWWLHRKSWDWKSHGLVVLVVSLGFSYYSYPYDEVIVLPALLAAAANGNRRFLLTGLILTNLGFAVYLSKLADIWGLRYMFLWWTGSAWMVTYLLSQPRPSQAGRIGLVIEQVNPGILVNNPVV